MVEKIVNGVPLFSFEILEKQTGIKHFVSGRKGGVSQGETESFNLSFSASDTKENVVENRKRLATALEIGLENLVFVSQYHSDAVFVLKGNEYKSAEKADAIVTDIKEMCICVMGADCVPLLAYDPVQKAIAAIHAGWRGTAASITAKTIKMMQQQYGSDPADILLSVGPSISAEKYEVGKDVYEEFIKAQGEEASKYFRYDSEKDKYFPDLWQANKEQGLKAGLRERNIQVAGLCTYSNPESFFSARYFKNRTGRFAAGIMLV